MKHGPTHVPIPPVILVLSVPEWKNVQFLLTTVSNMFFPNIHSTSNVSSEIVVSLD